jgi:hypothetical protein
MYANPNEMVFDNQNIELETVQFILDKYPKMENRDKQKILNTIKGLVRENKRLGKEISNLVMKTQMPQNFKEGFQNRKEHKRKGKRK